MVFHIDSRHNIEFAIYTFTEVILFSTPSVQRLNLLYSRLSPLRQEDHNRRALGRVLTKQGGSYRWVH